MKIKNRGQAGFHLLLVIIILAVVAVIGLLGWRFLEATKEKSGSVAVAETLDGLKKGCTGTGLVKMQHSPMDMTDVGSVVPAGTLAGAHVTPIDHLYFYPKDMQNRDAAPVYAMADGYIVSYQERTQSVDSGAAKQGEYRMDIQHNCDVFSYFDLMTSVDDSIKGLLNAGGNLHIPVKAGQVIGRVGAQSLDTAIYNYATTLSGFVKPESYIAESWKIHMDDFFKYFDNPIKAEMLTKNVRKVEPYGGKIDYDIDGKLIGNWFQEGTNGYGGPKELQGKPSNGGIGYWNGHFSIVPDAIKPTKINISFGYYEGQAKQFTAVEGSVDPATVGVGSGLVKYEYIQYAQQNNNPTGGVMAQSNQVMGTVLFQLTDTQRLKIEYFPGKTSSQVTSFTDAAKVYNR